MKHNLLCAAAIGALLCVPSVATANDDEGWYVRGNVGYGAFSDMDIEGDLVGDVEAEANGAGTVGVGYEFDNNWRLELDGSTMWNETAAISQFENTASDFRANALMLNAIYDFDDFGRWEPYVGAGVGYVQGKLSAQAHDFLTANDGNGTTVTSPVCSPICEFSDKDSGIGWQLLAGLGYELTDNISWDTHYRYLGATEFDFAGTRSAVGSTSSSAIASTIEDFGAHMLMTGFRYKFGAPKAAPVPTPAPTPVPTPPVEPAKVQCWDQSMAMSYGDCPAQPAPPPQPEVRCWDQSYVFTASECPPVPAPPVTQAPAPVSICDQGNVPFVVYFEWDKSRLTDQAQAVINQAASIANQCSLSGVNIEGHADTSGSAAYNVGLSKRRADVVSSALVNLGIDRNTITRDARGETAPAISTGDNVREPLNRRSEVVIRLVPTNSF